MQLIAITEVNRLRSSTNSSSGPRKHRSASDGVDLAALQLEEGGEEEIERTKCDICMSTCRSITTFLLSHVGLISLVVGYCVTGAFIFESLESGHEIQVKRNMALVRQNVTKYLWTMTRNADLIIPEQWVGNATKRLQDFEQELLRAMKKGGWDGSESENTMQWTFSGALFFSIVVCTTIGK